MRRAGDGAPGPGGAEALAGGGTPGAGGAAVTTGADAAATYRADDADAPALELRGLSCGHGRRPVLADVTLEVRPGELVALVGPNGSGKTTLLKTVAGHLRPLGGEVRLLGRDLASLDGCERARAMASLFTERQRTELLTCQDVVEAGRYPFTGALGRLGARDREQVRLAMEATRTLGVAGRDLAHVSDGQRQRVLLARALCQEPRVLVLDEPTSHLDVHAQAEVLRLLRAQARERGMAVLASLHEVDLAQKAADRVACVRDGRLVRQGPPDEVLDAAFVSELFGLGETSYDPAFGSVELGRVPGEPRVFVVAGAGTGAACFRALQRAGVPFATGVLHAHDVDGALARELASAAVLERDFEPVGDAALARAREVLAGCEAVVCCLGPDDLGPGNARNAELVALARELGLPVFPDAASCLAALGSQR